MLFNAEHETETATSYSSSGGMSHAARSARPYWRHWKAIGCCRPAALEEAASEKSDEQRRAARGGDATPMRWTTCVCAVSISFTEEVCLGPRSEQICFIYSKIKENVVSLSERPAYLGYSFREDIYNILATAHPHALAYMDARSASLAERFNLRLSRAAGTQTSIRTRMPRRRAVSGPQ